MVTAAGIAWLGLVAQSSNTVVPEPTRSILLMAILGIALLGLLMIVATLLGGHWVRRWGEHRRGPAVPPDQMLRRNSPDEQEANVPSKAPHGSIHKGPINKGDTISTDETNVS